MIYKIDRQHLPNMTRKELTYCEALVRRGEAEWVDPTPQEELEPEEYILSARHHLTAFTEATSRWQLDIWQHLLCERFTRMVLEGEKGVRLAVHAPPQNGKTVIASQRLPAFVLGHNPTDRFRLACYNQTHAEEQTGICLDIMMGEEYHKIFPEAGVRVPDRSPRGRFSTHDRHDVMDAQPSVLAMGLNTGFVGSGAEWFLMDDPYKSREEAYSEAINARIKRFWTATAKQRIEPECNVIFLFHRWAKGDLIGTIIEEEGLKDEGGDWEMMRFPALCDGKDDDPTWRLGLREVGEELSPRRPKYYLLKLKESNPMDFAALQQGDPVPEGGNKFRVEMIGDHDVTPYSPSKALLNLYLGVDLAISLKTSADHTAVGTLGQSPDQDTYILDINYERVGFNDALAKIESEAIEWGGLSGADIKSVAIETNAYQMSAFEEAVRRYNLPFTETRRATDKLTAAQKLIRRVNMGKVKADKRADWWPELKRQMEAFPDPTVPDDLIDCLVNGLEEVPIVWEEIASELRPPEWSADRVRELEDELSDLEARTRLN